MHGNKNWTMKRITTWSKNPKQSPHSLIEMISFFPYLKKNEDTLNGSHCSRESAIVFFDSPADLSAKVNHVKKMGYHGLFIWEIGQDDEQQSLSRAIYERMNPQDPSSYGREIRDQDFRVIYRPASGIELYSGSEELFSAELYSLDGKRLAHSDNHFRQARIPGQDLPTGIYILRLRSGDWVISRKLILGQTSN